MLFPLERGVDRYVTRLSEQGYCTSHRWKSAFVDKKAVFWLGVMLPVPHCDTLARICSNKDVQVEKTRPLLRHRLLFCRLQVDHHTPGRGSAVSVNCM